MRRWTMAVAAAGLLTLAAGVSEAGARPDKIKSWFGQFGGGYSVANGTFGDIVDDGYTLQGGALFWPQSWPVGVSFDLAYTGHDLNNEALRLLNEAIDMEGSSTGNITGGDVDFWSVSADLMWGPDTGKVGFYFLGGLGMDRVNARATTNGLVYYPPVCNPIYWWCLPGGVAPGTIIVGDRSSTEFSWNAGLGLTFEVSAAGSQIFVEARFRSVDTDREATEFIPIVVGYRW